MAWRKRRNRPVKRMLLMLAAAALSLWLGSKVLQALGGAGHSEEAEHIVDEFYKLEQEGDFGSSWELFHSSMKERYPKDKYIQTRAHILMQDFQSQTYEYTLGSSEKINDFQLKENGQEQESALPNVYAIQVNQHFETLYGPIELVQICYVAEENGEWSLLWQVE